MQYARPEADAFVDQWATHQGNTVDLFAEIDSVSPDDDSYVRSGSAPSEPVVVFALGAITQPATNDDHTVSYRYGKADPTLLIDLFVELREGYVDEGDPGDVIASWEHEDIDSEVTQADQLLDAVQAGSITDYSDLFLRFVAEVYVEAISLNREHVSLTVNQPFQLIASEPVDWESDNPNVNVDGAGELSTTDDHLGDDGQATIIAKGSGFLEAAKCAVTIVPWTANEHMLERGARLGWYRVSLAPDGTIWAGRMGTTTMYSTQDGFVTRTHRADTPVELSSPSLLFTAGGTFLRGDSTIYKSIDGQLTWTLCTDGMLIALYHMFDYYDDPVSGNTYVYTGEYSCVSSNRHRVIRGTIESDGTETWETVLEFYSPDEYDSDPVTYEFSARHIHVVWVDQATGHVYVGTGDTNHQSRILVSEDNGTTWRTLGTGSQDWRILSIWFTDDYVYWNMDTSSTQHIWRLARSDLAAQAPDNDLKEHVVTLDCGSHWYHIWVKDPDDNDAVLMATSIEGQPRDDRGRLFLLRELGDGSVETQEVYSAEVTTSLGQLEPKFQREGKVYVWGRNAVGHTALRQLQWAT